MASSQQKSILAIVTLAFMLVVGFVGQQVLSATWNQPDRVVVWIFDIGQGDAIFIDAPEAQILIDGGPSSLIIEKLSSVMPFWDRSIDYVINTHPHADHVTGLNFVLERYFVDEVWYSGQEYYTETFKYFEELSAEQGSLVKSGSVIDLGAGAKLTVLWPDLNLDNILLDDPNAGSITTLLTYNETTILLTGDIGVDEELQILDELPHIDVLKVPHQGSMTSSGPIFLRHIEPSVAVITVGKNDYGHPHPIIVDRYKKIGSEIIRTDQDGDVRIISDGGEPQIQLFKL